MSSLTERKYLFVCGPPRSGTTALGRCLNFHPRIVLGRERYKYRLLAREQNGFDYRGLFAKDRFFRFDPQDSNIDLGAKFYEVAVEKYDSAAYVGDKIPRLYRSISFLLRTFSPCRVIYVLREPVSVAASWQRRADDPDDSWPPGSGYERAVDEWNHALAIVNEFKWRAGDQLTVVRFSDLFGEHCREAFRTLFRRLDLSTESPGASRAWFDQIVLYSTTTRPPVLRHGVSQELLDYVARRADYDLYRQVCALDPL